MDNKELKKRIKNLQLPPLSEGQIENLKKKLMISFSEEFLELSKVGDFEYCGFFSIYNLNLDTPYSAIGETLRLRKDAGLPLDTLVLLEDDASILLMKCLGDHEEIYWIAIEDYYHYCDGEELLYQPTIFPTFTDFFTYLLDEEEKRSAEEAAK